MDFSIKRLRNLSIILLLLRVISLPFNILTDNTEARYAEIGRKMFETGNYITPFIDNGIPFWAKPPLSFWASALSYNIFGVNEFAAHLPHFLFLTFAIILIFYYMNKHFDKLTAYATLTIILSCSFFLYMMGGVMTDPALAFCITLVMVSFFNAVKSKDKLWGYLFFIGLGLGMLAKGPLIIVLTAASTGLWVLLHNQWKQTWKNLPWIIGTILMVAIFLPWYILAEQKTPGFLKYFVIGEHFERYITPNWKGDLYGAGRGGIKGLILIFWILSILPWGIYFISMLFRKHFRTTLHHIPFIKDERVSYLIFWVLVPILFFSLSSNSLIAYTIPMIPPTAALLAYIITQNENPIRLQKFVICSTITAFMLICITVLVVFFPQTSDKFIKSEKNIIAFYNDIAPQSPLIYYGKKPLSADFYSSGKAISTKDISELQSYLKKNGFIIIATNNSRKILDSLNIIFNTEELFHTRRSVLLKITPKDIHK